MDKETLSNYGWIVIAVLVLAVMIALASPFGHFIEAGVKSTAQGLFDVNQNAGAIAGLDIPDQMIAEPSEGGNTPQANVIPDGGTYYVGVTSTAIGKYTGATATYTAGQVMPRIVNDGDVYIYGDYEYRYNQYFSNSQWSWVNSSTQNGWGVRVLDLSKTNYGAILESINGEPVTNMSMTFAYSLITSAPSIPNSVTDMSETFWDCENLKTYHGSTDPDGDFSGYLIPSSVTDMTYTFCHCGTITTAPLIPSSVTVMSSTFAYCPSLLSKPNIPSSVTTAESSIFKGCTQFGY